MKILGFSIVFFAVIAVTVLAVGQLGLLGGQMPDDLGVHSGRLKAPSLTPNSISSQADLYPNHPLRDYARIDPIRYSGDPIAAMRKLESILKAMDGVVVVQRESEDYLYAQATTRLLKFTDDMEFWLDRQAGVIQVRSASRLGRKDFNVNRERLETIRAQFAKN
jgi:uncharacterized protein (DUF1499 family)